MTNYTSSKNCQIYPNKSPEWYDRFHTYLTFGQSRTLTSARRVWANSNSSPTGTAGKQAAKWRWKERALAYDQANRLE